MTHRQVTVEPLQRLICLLFQPSIPRCLGRHKLLDWLYLLHEPQGGLFSELQIERELQPEDIGYWMLAAGPRP